MCSPACKRSGVEVMSVRGTPSQVAQQAQVATDLISRSSGKSSLYTVSICMPAEEARDLISSPPSCEDDLIRALGTTAASTAGMRAKSVANCDEQQEHSQKVEGPHASAQCVHVTVTCTCSMCMCTCGTRCACAKHALARRGAVCMPSCDAAAQLHVR